MLYLHPGDEPAGPDVHWLELMPSREGPNRTRHSIGGAETDGHCAHHRCAPTFVRR